MIADKITFEFMPGNLLNIGRAACFVRIMQHWNRTDSSDLVPVVHSSATAWEHFRCEGWAAAVRFIGTATLAIVRQPRWRARARECQLS